MLFAHVKEILYRGGHKDGPLNIPLHLGYFLLNYACTIALQSESVVKLNIPCNIKFTVRAVYNIEG